MNAPEAIASEAERTRRLVQISEALPYQKQEILLAFANGMAAMLLPHPAPPTRPAAGG